MDTVFLFQSLVLNLKEEIVFAEDVTVRSSSFAGCFVFVFHQEFSDFSFETSGKSDQTFAVLGKKFFADARFVIKTPEGGLGRNTRQIAVAFFIFSQNKKMIV